MANKQLTASVRLNTTQFENKLKRIAKGIDALNNSIRRQTSAYDAVNNALRTTETKTRKAKVETDRLAESANRVNNNFKKTNNTIGTLGSKLKALAGAYLGVQTARLTIDTADTITSAQNKLNGLNGNDQGKTAESMDKIYAAAQRSRSSYSGMMSNVSKSMMLAGDSFQGNIDNAIRFQEIMAKAYTVGGASAQEQHSSMYQLVQALGSGTLAGDELRSVREGAPLAYKEIEKFAQKNLKTTESLKDLASQGVITSDMVVAAIMESGDEIEKKFKNTKMTFAQAWDQIKNMGTKAFEPALESLNELLNSASTEKFIQGIGSTLVLLGNTLSWLIDKLSQFFDWCANNWETVKTAIISAVTAITVYLVAMAVQAIISFVTAHWAVLLVVAAILVLIYIFHELGFTSSEILGGICGAVLFLGYLIQDIVVWVVTIVYYAIAIVWDIIVGAAVIIIDIVTVIGTAIGLVLQAIVQGVLWVITTIKAVIVTLYNIIYSIIAGIWGIIEWVLNKTITGFVDMGIGVLDVIYKIASAIDKVFGSNLGDSIQKGITGLKNFKTSVETTLDYDKTFDSIGNEWATSYADLGDQYAGRGQYDDWNITDNMSDLYNGAGQFLSDVGNTGMDLMLDPTVLDDWAISNTVNPMDGWDKGYAFGYDTANNVNALLDPNNPMYANLGGYDPSGAYDDIIKGMDKLGTNTDDIKNSMDLGDDDLDFLRSIAEMEWRKEFTTAEIKVDMTNYNAVNGERDLDGIVEYLSDVLREEMSNVAYGVHY